LSSKGQRSRSLGTKTQKLFFAHIFVKTGSIYVKPRPKWSSAHSRHIFETFHQLKCFVFVIFVSNYPGVPHVTANHLPVHLLAVNFT